MQNTPDKIMHEMTGRFLRGEIDPSEFRVSADEMDPDTLRGWAGLLRPMAGVLRDADGESARGEEPAELWPLDRIAGFLEDLSAGNNDPAESLLFARAVETSGAFFERVWGKFSQIQRLSDAAIDQDLPEVTIQPPEVLWQRAGLPIAGSAGNITKRSGSRQQISFRWAYAAAAVLLALLVYNYWPTPEPVNPLSPEPLDFSFTENRPPFPVSQSSFRGGAVVNYPDQFISVFIQGSLQAAEDYKAGKYQKADDAFTALAPVADSLTRVSGLPVEVSNRLRDYYFLHGIIKLKIIQPHPADHAETLDRAVDLLQRSQRLAKAIPQGDPERESLFLAHARYFQHNTAAALDTLKSIPGTSPYDHDRQILEKRWRK